MEKISGEYLFFREEGVLRGPQHFKGFVLGFVRFDSSRRNITGTGFVV